MNMGRLKTFAAAAAVILFLEAGAAPAALGEEREPELYAQAAVLMDGDSGRILLGKNEREKRPMASTTKVMTCILALEHSRGDEVVEVSSRAAVQPDVQLNIIEGEQFYMEDLLYSLMLKSHNDTAVAIAEHIGGSVEGFAKMMNDKAIELGCTDTHFVTPNGLDEEDEGGEEKLHPKGDQIRTVCFEKAKKVVCFFGNLGGDLGCNLRGQFLCCKKIQSIPPL